ncbi:MAG: NADH-quinone oxidoreductase subunit J [Clostridia bacterium]|nr:NADH-quinone oxidoreductase subunit J [Clostridia bacterium]
MTINLLSNMIYILIAVLFLLGIYGIVTKNNLIKKLIAMNIMQVAVIFFFLTLGLKIDATIPIEMPGIINVDAYINPLPHALMLTAIVVSLSTTGVALSLMIRIGRFLNTIEEDEILRRMEE